MGYQFEFADVLAQWPLFLGGAWLTIQLSVLAIVFGLVIGTFTAIGRRSQSRWLVRLCGFYVESVRNTPLLVQIFVVYFGFAGLGWRVPVFVAAVAALVINLGAYTAEIVRAGMDAIHKSQIEAAECLALTPAQIYWHVVLVPAFEKVYPALASQFVLLMLASSITSQIGAEELTAVASRVQSETYRSFEAYLVVALLYLLLSYVARAGFWGIGLLVFKRRRKLGTLL
ncbi:MAG TPA: amino acid ABC transporter permease [Lautropia sp.]|jgi:polar amino acid transport system permease protein|nr:amino acid ABC transporter permease [Lautropia sp.]